MGNVSVKPKPKKRGRKPVEGSARNGGERVVGIVSAGDVERIAHVCAELGYTRGYLMLLGLRYAEVELAERDALRKAAS